MAGMIDYIPFFKLRTQPFRLSPDPEFYYPSRSHRAALEVLKFAIERGEGFMVLTGCAGTGKTLLLRLLLKEIPQRKLPAVVVTPAVSPRGLIRLLLDELGVEVEERQLELAVLLKKLQETVLELAAMGKELLVIVDESQDLPVETIEQLRLLSNIELDDKKIIQILLVGQSELEQVLAHPGLRQLVQRIVINETIHPLSRQETGDYIAFRLARAGRGDLQVSSDALDSLFEETGGIPRLINRLMDRTLLMAASRGQLCIGREDVIAAASTLPRPNSIAEGAESPLNVVEGPKTFMSSRARACVVVGGLLIVTSLLWLFWSGASMEWRFPALSLISSITDDFFPNRHNSADVNRDIVSHSQPEERQVMVVVNRALVRKGPGNQFEFISAVSSGDLLVARGMDGNWVMVDVWDASGRRGRGWIRGDLVRDISQMGGRLR